MTDQSRAVVFGKEFGHAALRAFSVFLVVHIDGLARGLPGLNFAQFRAVFMRDASQPNPQVVRCVPRRRDRAYQVRLVEIARIGQQVVKQKARRIADIDRLHDRRDAMFAPAVSIIQVVKRRRMRGTSRQVQNIAALDKPQARTGSGLCKLQEFHNLPQE